jgi:hypothetical protein
MDRLARAYRVFASRLITCVVGLGLVTFASSCKKKKDVAQLVTGRALAVTTACARVSDENDQFRIDVLLLFDTDQSCANVDEVNGKWALLSLHRKSTDSSRALGPGSYASYDLSFRDGALKGAFSVPATSKTLRIPCEPDSRASTSSAPVTSSTAQSTPH